MATLRPLPCVLGETLGPCAGPGSKRVLSFFKVLLGIRRFDVGAWWYFFGGRNGTGHLSVVDPPMSPFYFFFSSFWVCVLLLQLVWCCVCIDGCMLVVALFIKRGENLFRECYSPL